VPSRLSSREVLALRGLRIPAITLKRLHSSGIFSQPSVSLEHQHLVGRYVIRGVESGGALPDLAAYCSFTGHNGQPLPWLQRVNSIGANGLHAIVLAPILVRLQMLRVQYTYDLLITEHQLMPSENGRRPKLHNSVIFHARGSLEMDLWGKDADLRGHVVPSFYWRSGEQASIPGGFQHAAACLTSAVSCVGCRHCHLLQANVDAVPHYGDIARAVCRH
jgi:hypothetical protein